MRCSLLIDGVAIQIESTLLHKSSIPGDKECTQTTMCGPRGHIVVLPASALLTIAVISRKFSLGLPLAAPGFTMSQHLMFASEKQL